MKSDSGKLLFRGYRVLLLAMILMFGLGAMPQASGMADDEPDANNDSVFSNTCEYDNTSWSENVEGRNERDNNHLGYVDDGITVFPDEDGQYIIRGVR